MSVSVNTSVKHPLFDFIEVVDHGIIRNLEDFVKLNIVDWNRYKSYWSTPARAMEVISSHFIDRMAYKVVILDLYAYPERDDFPGWAHAGNHEEIGRLYWNHFHYEFDGKLRFHDSPDFSGVIHHKDARSVDFYGDIGQVSPIAILDTIHRSVYGNTLWISVLDTNKQVILEPFLPVTNEVREVEQLIKSLDLLDYVHCMDGLLFLKWQKATLFVGNISEISQMSLQHFQELVYGLTGDVKFLKVTKGRNRKQSNGSNLRFTQLPMF